MQSHVTHRIYFLASREHFACKCLSFGVIFAPYIILKRSLKLLMSTSQFDVNLHRNSKLFKKSKGLQLNGSL